MRRVKQRQMSAEMPSVSRSEIRRIRRGRELSKQSGQGHGKRTKKLMSRTNFPMTRQQRHERKMRQGEINTESMIKRVFGR